MSLMIDRIPSPVGAMLLVSDGTSLRALEFEDHEERLRELLRLHYGACVLEPGRLPAPITRPILAYFAGDLSALADVPVATGGTPFQRRVWAELRRVPVGETTTYGALARTIGTPRAFRAVGAANGANPVSIVVPCHRVVGAAGALTGYGGGLPRKRWLLAHEGASLKGRSAAA